ncbi:MAG: hypothetical protein KKD44_29175 [Proteobacteria bacterium]|nr:hypothetical protein [Pseudomonadota bacterium]
MRFARVASWAAAGLTVYALYRRYRSASAPGLSGPDEISPFLDSRIREIAREEAEVVVGRAVMRIESAQRALIAQAVAKASPSAPAAQDPAEDLPKLPAGPSRSQSASGRLGRRRFT